MNRHDRFKLGPYPTTDNYATLGNYVWLKPRTNQGTIVVENVDGSNSAKVMIEAAVLRKGQKFLVELLPETTLAVGAKVVVHLDYFYPRVRIQVKSAAAGNSADVRAEGNAIY